MSDIGNIGQAVTGISQALVTTIASIGDAQKQQQFQQAVNRLNAQQQNDLNTKLLNANSENQRISILSNYLTNLNIQRINNISGQNIAQTNKNLINELLLIGGVFLVAVVGIVFMVKKK